MSTRPKPIEGGTIFMLINESSHIAPEGSHRQDGEWFPLPAGVKFLPNTWYATPNDQPCPVPLNP